MIETAGTITVVEAAKRLNKSTEQVRRDLREGKLKGQRVGNQWFVDEAALKKGRSPVEPLIPRETLERIRKLRKEINEANTGEPFDVVKMLRQHRGEDD